MKILHITFDYAADNVGKSTIVVKDLIEETGKFSEVKIISLHRNINPFREKNELKSTDIINYNLFGFPYGLFIKSNMYRTYIKLLSNQICSQVEYENLDFIHSHKLTFEGFVGFNISKKYNKKLIISLRQTDFYVLKYRKDLLSYCSEILKKASIIFYIAPYMKQKLIDIFGRRFFEQELAMKLIFLPNSIDVENFRFNPGKRNNYNFLSIFWMHKKAVKRKNVKGLFKALSLLKKDKFILDVIGVGEYKSIIQKWTKQLNISDHVNFLGFVNNDVISDHLAKSKAFLLPSFSETLGMTYVESLLCGTPVLYSKNTGFDGFFENVGVAVNPYSTDDIANGIKKLNNENEFFIENITKLHQEGAFDIFRKESIRQIYKNAVNKFV